MFWRPLHICPLLSPPPSSWATTTTGTFNIDELSIKWWASLWWGPVPAQITDRLSYRERQGPNTLHVGLSGRGGGRQGAFLVTNDLTQMPAERDGKQQASGLVARLTPQEICLSIIWPLDVCSVTYLTLRVIKGSCPMKGQILCEKEAHWEMWNNSNPRRR